MRKILVIGGSGMLGKDIVKHFVAKPLYKVFSIQRNSVPSYFPKEVEFINIDILDTENFKRYLKNISPDLIIHCAAVVDVDYCESNPDFAYKLNAEVVKEIHATLPFSKLIFISTDSVFDGKTGDYTELSKVNMLNKYAESKYQGEQYALQLFSNSIVIRTNIYGFHYKGNGNSLAEWAIGNFKKKQSFFGFHDVYFNPVYTKQLAKICDDLDRIDFAGLINVGSDRFINKFKFLQTLATIFKFDTSLLQEKSINDFNFNAKRPVNTTLNVTFLNTVLGYTPSFSGGMADLAFDFNQFINSSDYE